MSESNMVNTSLVIMAAGIGSRFGTGIKQLARVDDNDHIIMDYSIHDAIAAGFNKIIIIIRKDIEEEFKEVIGNRVSEVCNSLGVRVEYALQSIDDIPGNVPDGRTKPWGTGQAVLAARDYINEPFAVINADDYYGKEPFKLVHDFLCEQSNELCMAGFVLKNTLSDNGEVTRGVCVVEDGYLTSIKETKQIHKAGEAAFAGDNKLDIDSMVSMNMWGFNKEFLKTLESGFEEFIINSAGNDPLKSEYLIPVFIGQLLEREEVKVRALRTDAVWCGMTYKEDIPQVAGRFREMIANGDYYRDLFSDLKAFSK